MDDDSPSPKERKGIREKWVSMSGRDFQDLFSEIESDDGEVAPEQLERAKRLEKKQMFRE